jgi:hypothetical protein
MTSTRFTRLATKALTDPAFLDKLKNDTAATLQSFGIDDPHAVTDVQNALAGIDQAHLDSMNHLLLHLKSGPS